MGRGTLLALIAIAALAGRGAADPQTAADPQREAERLAKAGDYVGAAARFRAAYAADPRPELMCNVGVAYFKAKTEMPRAQLFLSRCLERGSALDKKFIDSVRAVLGLVEDQLRAGDFTPVDVNVTPASGTIAISDFAADERFLGSRIVWLPFGKHTLSVSAEGYIPKQTDIATGTHERLQVQITLERAPVAEPAGTSTGTGSGSDSGSGSAVLPPPPPTPRREAVHHETARPSIVPPLVTTGVTIAALVVGGVAYGKARDRATLSQYAVTDDVRNRDGDYIRKWNMVTWATGAVALAGAVTSGLLWARGVRAGSNVEVSPTPGGASLAWGATW